MFYFKCKDINERDALISNLRVKGVYAVFHYIPLHSSIAGEEHGTFFGEDKYTTILTQGESERLVRLPIFYNLERQEQETIIKAVLDFFE